MASAFKWIRVVVFFSLIVMTTAMAASPVRDVMAPLVAKSFARWSGTQTPVATPLAVDAPQQLAATTVRPLTPLGTAEEFRVMTAASPNSNIGAADRFDYSSSTAAAGDDEARESLTPEQLAALAKGSSSRFDLGPWQPVGSGQGARGGAASLARGNNRGGAGGFAGGITGSGGGSGAASGGGAGAAGGGSNAGAGPTRTPAPLPGQTSGVFTQHTNGLPVLTSGGGGVGTGSVTTITSTTVAANPEPSTLLLLGTGIMLAASALRRRLARQS